MKKTMGLFAIVLVLAVTPALAQVKSFNSEVALPAGGELSLYATKGSVRLTAWDRDQVEIRARIESDSNFTEYARRAVEATTVDVTTAGDRIMIRSNYNGVPTGWLFAMWQSKPSIHYEIRAPKRIGLRLDIDRSATTINGFDGRIILDLDRSEVKGTDLAGDLRVNINRGGDSSFGNVRGSLTIIADRTNLRIDVMALRGSSRLDIHRGDADVSVARGQGFELDTSLTRRADFNTNVSPTQSRNRKNPSGSINGGGPRLWIGADRSSVRLRS